MAEDKSAIPLEIDPPDLDRMRREGTQHLVVDVREAWELEVSKLSDSLHMPLGDVPKRFAELPKDRTLVILCRSGRRSLDATNFLRQQGYAKATNLRGGINLWAAQIDSKMGTY